jgi:transglutaminase-like putative cysteine protease
MTTYILRHTTRYEYDLPVVHAHHTARLRPRQLSHQRVISSELMVRPGTSSLTEKVDYFGNITDALEVAETHEVFEVTSQSTVTTLPNPLSVQPPIGHISWESAVCRLDATELYLREAELRFDSPLVRVHQVFKEYAAATFTAGRDLVESVIELNRRIHEDFKYEPAATDVSTPLGQVMRERRGVCQDFAHVAVACLRSVGLAGRYVSGYLETIPPEGKERLVGADASHAWAAVFVPGQGWLDFDPTNDLLPSERHIWAAWGRDFSDVSPLKGVVLGGGAHRLTVGVDVAPVVSSRPPALAVVPDVKVTAEEPLK